jgi:hypothetical protein
MRWMTAESSINKTLRPPLLIFQRFAIRQMREWVRASWHFRASESLFFYRAEECSALFRVSAFE